VLKRIDDAQWVETLYASNLEHSLFCVYVSIAWIDSFHNNEERLNKNFCWNAELQDWLNTYLLMYLFYQSLKFELIIW